MCYGLLGSFVVLRLEGRGCESGLWRRNRSMRGVLLQRLFQSKISRQSIQSQYTSARK